MVHWIFGGVAVVSLAMIAYGAPQNSRSNPVTTTGAGPQQSAYKNNSRESTSELFGYPEDPSAIESNQNARNRTPVYIPNRCQQNEILYPGDQESDWVCDCKPTFVYHAQTRQCYQLFTQAYCVNGAMVTMEKGAKHPKCVVNDCYDPNVPKVRFMGECVQLNAYHVKCLHHKVQQVVSVDEETNQLGCVNISEVENGKNLPSTTAMENNTNSNSANSQRF